MFAIVSYLVSVTRYTILSLLRSEHFKHFGEASWEKKIAWFSLRWSSTPYHYHDSGLSQTFLFVEISAAKEWKLKTQLLAWREEHLKKAWIDGCILFNWQLNVQRFLRWELKFHSLSLLSVKPRLEKIKTNEKKNKKKKANCVIKEHREQFLTFCWNTWINKSFAMFPIKTTHEQMPHNYFWF